MPKRASVVNAPPTTALYARAVTMPTTVEKPSAAMNSKPYKLCRLSQVNRPQEEFYWPSSNQMITCQIIQVVNEEGPISHSLLCRRIIQAWGLTRVGNRIDDRIRKLCGKLKLPITRIGRNKYYWPEKVDPVKYTLFRVPSNDNQTRRNIDDIPCEEMKNAALYVLRQQISLPEDDLVREVARLFGYHRIGAAGYQHIINGIGLLLKSGVANRDKDTRIVLVK